MRIKSPPSGFLESCLKTCTPRWPETQTSAKLNTRQHKPCQAPFRDDTDGAARARGVPLPSSRRSKWLVRARVFVSTDLPTGQQQHRQHHLQSLPSSNRRVYSQHQTRTCTPPSSLAAKGAAHQHKVPSNNYPYQRRWHQRLLSSALEGTIGAEDEDGHAGKGGGRAKTSAVYERREGQEATAIFGIVAHTATATQTNTALVFTEPRTATLHSALVRSNIPAKSIWATPCAAA